mgnify:CR=1 FL=1
MCSAFYSNSIKDFLNQNEDEIFGIIAKNDEILFANKKMLGLLKLGCLKRH